MFIKDILAYLVFTGIMGAVAVPKFIDSAKRTATKAEMNTVIGVLQMYEIEHEATPSSLSNLKPEYFATDAYKKDAWSNAYTYDKTTRKLCSTNAAIGCMEF